MLRCFLFFIIVLVNIDAIGAVKAGVGAIFYSVKSNLEVTDNKRVNSLDKPDTFQSGFIPVLELIATKENNGKTFFGGTDFSESFRGFSLGVKTASEMGKMTVAVSFSPFKKVWKNPYLTGVDRSETYAYEYVGYFNLEGVKKTNFSLKYSLQYTDVKSEKIPYDDLKRDGFLQRFVVGYKINTKLNGFYFLPEFGLAYNSAQGDSNSYFGYFGGISGIYGSRDKRFFLKIGYENDNFNKKDPVFLKNRDDRVISAIAGVTFNNIFNKNKLYATLVAGYSVKNTNIDFYYETKLFSGVIIGYKF